MWWGDVGSAISGLDVLIFEMLVWISRRKSLGSNWKYEPRPQEEVRTTDVDLEGCQHMGNDFQIWECDTKYRKRKRIESWKHC